MSYPISEKQVGITERLGEETVKLIYDIVRVFEPIGVELDTPGKVVSLFRAYQEKGIIPREREAVVGFYMTARNSLVSMHIISIGTSRGSPCSPLEVFRPAIVEATPVVVVAHNHPSGDCKPSLEDRTVTERLLEASRILGIDLLDHLVIGTKDYSAIISDGLL
ncbi:MAG: hypothetical protein D6698_16565 [Gammaproteobacteria bacterium]|nr:MAG: hypothetical protein D6698_16565 [Gammaproteobacteria bacterium]